MPNLNESLHTNERSIAAYVWLFGWLAVGGWLLSDALPPSGADARASVSPAPLQRSLPIEQITVGHRVASGNPTGEEDLQFGRDIDRATWKKLTLKAPKRDGSLADVVLLRPDEWLAEQQARVGGTVEISVPECGIDGHARVLAIENCPPVADGNGQVVTGTFQHQSAAVIDIAVAGEEEPIGTTTNHPFWSEDKQTFVRADQLQPGETLRTLSGLTTVTSITPRAGPEPVYNIEVAVAHTYHVGDGGVLVHNGGGLPGVLTCYKPAKEALKNRWKSTFLIDMNNAPAGARTNALGFPRDSRWFFRQLRDKERKLFSQDNIERINRGLAPVVDEQWIKYNPQHAVFEGQKLVHHHIDQGRFASAIPEFIHNTLDGILHTRVTE